MGILGEDLGCEIEIENSGEQFSESFSAGDDIIFKMDFSDGSTNQFKGILEERTNVFKNGLITLKIRGSQLSGNLLDIMVTEEYSSAKISDIWKDLVDQYLTGYTYNNVETINTQVDVKWENKPLLDCFIDLMNLGDCDAYLDDTKDFHLFLKNSKVNDQDAIVWEDSLIELKGLGTDSVDVRNKIQIIGEADGLPVLFTSQDSSSQGSFGVKEKVLTATSVTDETQAEKLAGAEKTLLKNPPEKGSAVSLFLPNIKPAHLIYVIFPPHKIHKRYRPIKYTFKVPSEEMEVFFSQEKSIPKLFKERIQKDLNQEPIKNPFKMLYSYNFTFDDMNKIDEAASNNIEVEDGNLKIVSGTTGTMVSATKEFPQTINKVSLQVKGESLSGTEYYFTADGSDNWQKISGLNLEEDVVNKGKKLKVKVVLNSSNTRIDALALLFK
jgi:hypothetical protein